MTTAVAVAVKKPAPHAKPLNTTLASNSLVRSNIWSEIVQDFKMDHKAETPQVQKQIRLLLREKVKLQSILINATPYLYFIHQTTQAKGLPGEISLLPFVESEFNPNDHSHKGALGLWQLMAGTARQLGIKVANGYDGRRNIVDSTQAATAHLKYLGGVFKGNWHFAVAAYNCGQGRILSAKRYYGSLPVWHLPVPQETKAYVARLLAIAYIVKHPVRYGIVLPPVMNQPFFTEIKLKKAISLYNFAKKSNTDFQRLRQLNPDFAYGSGKQKSGFFHILVPTTFSLKNL